MNYDLIIRDIETALNSESWDQRVWHCGTSHCVAGFADIRLGAIGNTEGLENDVQADWGCNNYTFDYITNALNDRKKMEEIIQLLKYAKEGIYKLDSDGYDLEGYNQQGYDWEGFNRRGEQRGS